MIVRFADGSRVSMTAPLGDRVVGRDIDGDLLVPLFKDDGADGPYVPLTPCCFASGKGSESPTGIVCRACYRPVDAKYGGTEELVTPVDPLARYQCDDPSCHREHTPDGGALPEHPVVGNG